MQDEIQDRRKVSPWNWLFQALGHTNLHNCLSREVWLFLAFSIADVVLTYKLLSHGGHFESNPVARFFMSGWGWKGMIYFKFSMVGFVFVMVQVIAYKRIETARRVLNFAIVAVGIVVTYSSVLYLRAAI